MFSAMWIVGLCRVRKMRPMQRCMREATINSSADFSHKKVRIIFDPRKTLKSFTMDPKNR